MKTKTFAVEQEPEFETLNEMIELQDEVENVEETNTVRDFDLRDAVIYSEILNGAWSKY